MNMLTGRFARPTGENTVTGSMWFHIGANMDQRTQVYIGTMSAMALGLRNVGDETIMTLETPDEANRAIGTLDEAIKKINKQRADLGAYQNRLEKTIVGLDIGAENLQASESRIRDANMAKETVNFTRDNVLSQAGTAMIAQANQSSQNVLSLLRWNCRKRQKPINTAAPNVPKSNAAERLFCFNKKNAVLFYAEFIGQQNSRLAHNALFQYIIRSNGEFGKC